MELLPNSTEFWRTLHKIRKILKTVMIFANKHNYEQNKVLLEL